MLIELILANNIQYLRKNKFAGMDENYMVFIWKSTKLPFFNSNRKIKEHLYIIVYQKDIKHF